MRMINADDLEQALRDAGLAEVIKDDCSKCTSAWGVPIVDAEPVVRCKDCRWLENDGYHTRCRIMGLSVEAEDYCSRGERRKDGKTDNC